MKTYSATPKDIERGWYLIDAEGVVLGRLTVADRLRGKHKPLYSPNLDCGDHVVVVNAGKIALTGSKLGQKTYYRHTGYPGGIKQRTAGHPGRRASRARDRKSGRADVAQGPLGRQQIRKLHVYRGQEHPHQGQAPTAVDLAARNRKNSVRESANG